MKASKRCPKCNSLRVGHLEHQWQSDEGHGSAGPKAMPVGVVEEVAFFFKSREAVGQLEAYLCADCGYFETYVRDPASVPYEKLQGFSWLNPESVEAGPYR